MARYIDADRLCENLTLMAKYQEPYKQSTILGVVSTIKNTKTADVVPRSEVDKLIGKFECFLCHVTGSRLSKHTYDLRTMETVANDCINETYNDGYGEGYKECAREIFEEIEKLSHRFMNDKHYIFGDMVWDIAELKKKYTEDKDEQAPTRDPI